jgi:hypothetical protein
MYAEYSSMKRDHDLSQIAIRFEVQPVVALLGLRQCGKTTLARLYADRLPDLPATRFDLEDPTDLAALTRAQAGPAEPARAGHHRQDPACLAPVPGAARGYAAHHLLLHR